MAHIGLRQYYEVNQKQFIDFINQTKEVETTCNDNFMYFKKDGLIIGKKNLYKEVPQGESQPPVKYYRVVE